MLLCWQVGGQTVDVCSVFLGDKRSITSSIAFINMTTKLSHMQLLKMLYYTQPKLIRVYTLYIRGGEQFK